MDELDEFDALDDVLDEGSKSVYRGKIPASLTALCILTFVGSVFILIKDAFTYQYMEGDADFPLVYLGDVLSCLGTITGGILMLNKKLFGFYIYLFSNIIYFASTLWYWLEIIGLQLNESTVLLIFIYVAAPAGFIIMYSSHKKYFH